MHREKSGLITFFHEGKSMWQSRCARHKQHVAKVSENASEQKHCASKDANSSDGITQQTAYEKNASALPLELCITDALRRTVSLLSERTIETFYRRHEDKQYYENSSSELRHRETLYKVFQIYSKVCISNFKVRHKNSVLSSVKRGRAECVAGTGTPCHTPNLGQPSTLFADCGLETAQIAGVDMRVWRQKYRVFAIITLSAITALFQLTLLSENALAGSLPYQAKAQVLYVIDGDTFRAQVQIWQDLTIETSVRVARIDTPEKKRGSECEAERQAGYAASDYAKQFLHKNDQVILSGMKPGKYAGRIIAEVQLADGRNFSDLMLSSGHAIPYDGGRKNKVWCR